MGNMPVNAECCQTCMYWECKSRDIVDGDKVRVYSDYNRCSLNKDTQEWRHCCAGYRNMVGAQHTYRPSPESMRTVGEAFLDTIMEINKTERMEAARRAQEKQTCSTCGGSGLVTCWNCGGTGKKSCSHCDGEGGFRIKLEVRENYERFTKSSYWLPDPDLDLKFYGYGSTEWGEDGVDDFDQHDVICDKEVEIDFDADPKAHVKDALQVGTDDFDYPNDISDELRAKIAAKFDVACEGVDAEARNWSGDGWSQDSTGHRIKDASVTVKRTPCVVRVRFKDAMGFPYEALVNLANNKVHLYDVKPEDAAPVMEGVEKRAEAGDVELQNDIGQMYAHYSNFNHVVAKDYEKAAQWFLKAAKAGFADAMDNIGNCYKNGDGVEEGKELAVLWYSKAAKKGLPWGQYHYAKCFLNGTGVEEDNDMALHWYMKAARQGLAVAQKMVSRCAEEGWGMKEDPEIAFYWMEKAANNGDEVAMHNLSVFYGRGYGCEEDESMKDEWADKAKENGYVEPTSAGCW